jgi:hypothetical protein
MDLTTKQLYSFGDSLYFLSAPGTWGTTQAEAQGVQGNLVTINDAAEQTFLAGMFAGQSLWIGYSDSGAEGSFQWVSGESSAYTNWAKGQPDDYAKVEDFAVKSGAGSWLDQPGSETRSGIIEIKNPAIPIITIDDLGIIEPIAGSRQALFTVRRYGSNNSIATVNYSTANGTTVAGSNYTATSGTLIFNPGETVKTIAVNVSQDADTVSGETFFVNLSNAANAVLGDNQAKATMREVSEVVTFGGHTYLLTNPGNWGQAELQARSFGGHLVTINSAEEQTFLAGKYAGQKLWIGYSDAGKEWDATTNEGFQWVDGTSAYTNWATSQPDNYAGTEDFVILGGNGSWFDVAGTDVYRGIIEIPAIVNPSPPPADRLIFTSNQDILTGGAGGDRFLCQGKNQKEALRRSTVGILDRITDFDGAEGDRIQLDFDNTLATIELPKKLFNANQVTGRTLTNATQSAYADKNHRNRGKQGLGIREAVFFQWRDRTYLSVNDTNRRFTANRDLVIDMTGIQMIRQDTTRGQLTVSNYFI